MTKVKIEVEAADKASGVIKETAKAAMTLDQALAKLARQDQLNTTMKEAEKRFASMTAEQRKAAIAADDLAQAQEAAAKAAADAADKANSTKWTELRSKIDLVVGGLRTAGEMMQKVFEFGKAGAVIAQTAESFDRLTISLGGSTDLLAQLREVSRGTMSDMDLMSNTTALLAGANKELGTELMSASPRLLEIAKAASVLNPQLGDTAYMYQSLALGIKRGSYEILDNLGLTIRLGEAYDTYAAKVGKASDELTANEQKIALLNYTLDQGQIIIDQAGGAAGGATDNFNRFEAALANLTNRAKEDAAPAISSVAAAMASVLEQALKNDELSEYTRGMTDVERGAYMARAAVLGLTAAEESSRAAISRNWQEKEAAKVATEGLAAAQVDNTAELWKSEAAWDAVLAKVAGAKVDAEGYYAALKAANDAQANLNATLEGFNTNYGDTVARKLEEAGLKGEKYEAALGMLDERLGTNMLAQKEANDELDAAIAHFKKTGDVEAFATAIDTNRDSFEKLDEKVAAARDRLKEAQTAFENFVASMQNANGMTFTLNIRTSGGTSSSAAPVGSRGSSGSGGSGGGTDYGYDIPIPGRATGGPVYRGETYWVGEKGPEPFVPSENGRIIPNNQAMGGGVTIAEGAIQISGAGDPSAVANAVMARLGQMFNRSYRGGAAYAGG